MRALTIIVAFIVGLMVVSGFTMMVGDINRSYGTSMNPQDLELLANISDMYNFSTEAGQQLETESEHLSQEGLTLDSGDKVWNALNVLWDALKFIPSSISMVAYILGVPAWMEYAVLAIVILVFLIGLIALITGALRGVV